MSSGSLQLPVQRITSGVHCRQHSVRVCSLLTLLMYAITAGQVAVYVVALWQNGWLIEQLSHNPLVGPSESALRALGSLSTSDLVDLHQYWRLLASIFLCSGLSMPCSFGMSAM